MADGQGSDSGRGVSAKTILLGLLAVVLVLIAVLNTDETEFDWIFGTFRAPLIVVIGISALLGFLIGWLVRGHRDRD